MYGWLTFYHQGYEVAKEFRPYMTDLQVRLQKVSPVSLIIFSLALILLQSLPNLKLIGTLKMK